jgi:hypothetical protein
MGNIEDHIMGYMPHQVSVRPHHDPYRCPWFHCTHIYEFDVAGNYFSGASGNGTITVPCCCCSNPAVQVTLPNETLTGEFKNKCGCCENRFTLEFQETGDFVTFFSAGFCIKLFPILAKVCKHRKGYFGNAREEGDSDWRYVVRERAEPPKNAPCCGGCCVCPKPCQRIKYSATHKETKSEELKQLIASRHSAVFQSELPAPYPASVNGTLDYRFTYKKVCCYPCGSLFSWRLADANTADGESDNISSIDVRYRGSYDQNNASDNDGRIMLAMALHRAYLLGNALRLNVPIMVDGDMPGFHPTQAGADYLNSYATTVPKWLGGSMV